MYSYAVAFTQISRSYIFFYRIETQHNNRNICSETSKRKEANNKQQRQTKNLAKATATIAEENKRPFLQVICYSMSITLFLRVLCVYTFLLFNIGNLSQSEKKSFINIVKKK